MEISSAAASGVMRIGLQIISAHKRPLLEIYHQIRNIYGPEIEYEIPEGVYGTELRKYKTRHQEVFVEFNLVNIGGERAENVKLSIQGELRRNSPRESFGSLFETIIPQIAPGQSRFLFKFDQFDLLEYEWRNNTGNPKGMKTTSFTITIEYDAGPSILNSLFSAYAKVKGKRRFESKYTFSPQLVEGDIPPAEYA